MYSELKLLKKLRQRERKIVNELLVQAQVVVATLHGSGSYELKTVLVPITMKVLYLTQSLLMKYRNHWNLNVGYHYY